jgi:type IV secretory pathway VirB2 component (pilin)
VISTSSTNKASLIKKVLIIAGAIITLVVPFFIWQHDANVESAQSLCPFKMATGLPCPGCGITKSFISIYQGDWLKSLSYHLFGPLAFVLSFIVILVLSIEIFSGKKYFRWLVYNKKLAWGLAIVLMIYHFTRLIVFLSSHSFDQILKESIWK